MINQDQFQELHTHIDMNTRQTENVKNISFVFMSRRNIIQGWLHFYSNRKATERYENMLHHQNLRCLIRGELNNRTEKVLYISSFIMLHTFISKFSCPPEQKKSCTMNYQNYSIQRCSFVQISTMMLTVQTLMYLVGIGSPELANGGHVWCLGYSWQTD